MVIFYGQIFFNGDSVKNYSTKTNIIWPADNFYCAGIVNFNMLAFMLEAFGNIRNTRARVNEDVRVRTEVKWRYRREVAHGRNPRAQVNLCL